MSLETDRYVTREGSQLGHSCCFDAAVLDITKPVMIGDKHYEDKDGKHYETVCECPSMEEAELICRALNATGEEPK